MGRPGAAARGGLDAERRRFRSCATVGERAKIAATIPALPIRQPCTASQWPDLTECRAASATGGGEFLPRPEGLLARAKKHVAFGPSHSFGVLRASASRPAGRPSPGPSIAIEAAAGVARNQQGETIMATIGTFTQVADGSYTGSIKTLTLNGC
jgi:hypothetical protein